MWQDGGKEGETEKDGAEKSRRRGIEENIKNKHSRMDGEVV